MKILYSQLDYYHICPINALKELVLNLKADCVGRGIHPNNIQLRVNVDNLISMLKHPLVKDWAKNEITLGELVGAKIVPYKGEYKNTVCAYHDGVILDTILFYI